MSTARPSWACTCCSGMRIGKTWEAGDRKGLGRRSAAFPSGWRSSCGGVQCCSNIDLLTHPVDLLLNRIASPCCCPLHLSRRFYGSALLRTAIWGVIAALQTTLLCERGGEKGSSAVHCVARPSCRSALSLLAHSQAVPRPCPCSYLVGYSLSPHMLQMCLWTPQWRTGLPSTAGHWRPIRCLPECWVR